MSTITNRFGAKAIIATLATLAVSGATINSAKAQSLTPGTMITPSVTFSGSDLGTLLDSQQNDVNFVFGGETLNFTARSAVYQNTNGTLDFLYQLVNAPTSSNSIGRFTVSLIPLETQTSIAFSSDDVDGTGIFSSGTFVPDGADRGPSGSPIGFDFRAGGNGRILAGGTSAILRVRTDATNFQPGRFAVINGVAASTGSFSPSPSGGVSIVNAPEPASLTLFAPLAFAGLALARRKR